MTHDDCVNAFSDISIGTLDPTCYGHFIVHYENFLVSKESKRKGLSGTTKDERVEFWDNVWGLLK